MHLWTGGPGRGAVTGHNGEGGAATGLDTCAVTWGKDGQTRLAPDEPFRGLRLRGGWGSSLFRGQVYAEVVAAATGQSLHQNRSQLATVADMAQRLRAAVEEAKRAETRTEEAWIRGLDGNGEPRMYRLEFRILEVAGCEIHDREAEDLARWFEICAERGYAVEGRWSPD